MKELHLLVRSSVISGDNVFCHCLMGGIDGFFRAISHRTSAGCYERGSIRRESKNGRAPAISPPIRLSKIGASIYSSVMHYQIAVG